MAEDAVWMARELSLELYAGLSRMQIHKFCGYGDRRFRALLDRCSEDAGAGS
jgi:hypothetical protein